MGKKTLYQCWLQNLFLVVCKKGRKVISMSTSICMNQGVNPVQNVKAPVSETVKTTAPYFIKTMMYGYETKEDCEKGNKHYFDPTKFGKGQAINANDIHLIKPIKDESDFSEVTVQMFNQQPEVYVVKNDDLKRLNMLA